MEAEEASVRLSISPTFSSYSSGSRNLAEIAARVVREIGEEPFADAENHGWKAQGSIYRFRENSSEGVRSGENGEDEEFEFKILCREPDASTSSAHEIFYNGQIKPVYPVFNRNLLPDNSSRVESGSENLKTKPAVRRSPLRKLMNEEEFKTTSEANDLGDHGGVSSETHCVWSSNTEKSSSGRSNKRNSSGSSNRWKLRDLLYNYRRSKSEVEDSQIMRTTSIKKNDQLGNESKVIEDTRSNTGLTNSSSSNSGFATVSLNNARLWRNRTVKEPEKKRSYFPYRHFLV